MNDSNLNLSLTLDLKPFFDELQKSEKVSEEFIEQFKKALQDNFDQPVQTITGSVEQLSQAENTAIQFMQNFNEKIKSADLNSSITNLSSGAQGIIDLNNQPGQTNTQAGGEDPNNNASANVETQESIDQQYRQKKEALDKQSWDGNQKQFAATLNNMKPALDSFIDEFTKGSAKINDVWNTLMNSIYKNFTDKIENMISGGLIDQLAGKLSGTGSAGSAESSGGNILDSIFGFVGSLFGSSGGARAAAAIPLADGGIVNKPTYALVGENNPEAVMPLNQLNTIITNQNFAQYSNLPSNNNVNVSLQPGIALDGTKLKLFLQQVDRELDKR